MRLPHLSRAADAGSSFEQAYPLVAGLRRANARQAHECEQTLKVFDSFANNVAAANFVTLDRSGFIDPAQSLEAVLVEACRYGIFTLALPRSLGGQGASLLALNMGLERLARCCLGIANLLSVHGLALGVLGATGALTQLQRLATQIVEGERRGTPFLLSTAATEPSAGTDMEDVDLLARAQLHSQAVRVSGGWKLSGRKVFVSNGSLASAHVVLMPTDMANPVQTLSAFLVEACRPGLRVVRVERKLGQRACPASELCFDDCFVPDSHKLNQRTVAGKSLDLVLGASRTTVAAFGSGVAWGVLDDCLKFYRTGPSVLRRTLESRGADALLSQMWQNARLARANYIEAVIANAVFGLISLMQVAPLRQLDRVVPPSLGAWATTRGWFESPRLDREARRWIDHISVDEVAVSCAHASAAKIAGSRLALQNCQVAFELLGPEATRESAGIAKRWRDARLLAIYEGTNELNAIDVYKKAVLPELEGLR
jgi:acyl-CoA dehydrogenase